MVQRVLLCRHGQGYHNATADEPPKLMLKDPELTAQGVGEARAIFADAPGPGRLDFKPEVAFVSPLWRTLQTATQAMASRSDGHTCPIVAMEDVREHNNMNGCNHRRPISEAHREAFPSVDFSGVDVNGPPPGAEWEPPYRAAFGVMRARAARALETVGARPEQRVAVFCHGSFLRALLSNVLELGPHHAVQAPRTGQAVELWRVETPSGERYWELQTDPANATVVTLLSRRGETRPAWELGAQFR